MGRLAKACLAVALVSPVFVMLANAEQPICVEAAPPETTTTLPDTESTVPSTPTTTVSPATTVAPDQSTTTTTVPASPTPETPTPESPAPETTVPDTTESETTPTTVVKDGIAAQSVSATSADSSLPANDSYSPLQPLFNGTSDEPTTPTETVPPHVNPECPPIIEVLEFPGWGTSLDFLNDKAVNDANGSFDVVRVSSAGIEQTQAPVIQPAFPRSTDVYTVSAKIAVTSPVTLEALSEVTMCWHKTDAPKEDVSSDCSTLDPRYNFKMTWNEAKAAVATDEDIGFVGFRVARDEAFGRAKYRNVRSYVETTDGVASYDKNASSMTIKFNFKVSSAMAAGEQKWSVSLAASYDSPSQEEAVVMAAMNNTKPLTTSMTVENLSVGYVSAITMDKELVDFGAVAPGAQKASQELKLGKYQANAESELVIQGTNYSCVGEQCTSALVLVNDSATSGTVMLDCRPKDGDAIKVGETKTPFLVVPSTGETEQDLPSFTCTVLYGGGAQRALSQYVGPISLYIRRVSQSSD